VLGIIVEVQLGIDQDKRYSWPVYAATLRARLRCPTTVLVVTPDRAVAAWACRRLELGPGSFFAPAVVGPDAVQRISSVAAARRCPEMAVLSVLAHRREADVGTLAVVALDAAVGLDEERSTLYCDLILSALEPAARACLEKLMKTGYEFQSDFAKKYFSMGRAQGVRELLLRQLERLGVELDRPTSARIDAASVETLAQIAETLVLAGDPDAVAEAIRRHLASPA
jgi:hypothetical protein